jgi:hypothetical protein
MHVKRPTIAYILRKERVKPVVNCISVFNVFPVLPPNHVTACATGLPAPPA